LRVSQHMTDRLVERTVRAFSDDLASDRPVPGGGSAAAYAGAMGAALAAMVGRISARKDESEQLRAFVDEMDNLRADFLRLAGDGERHRGGRAHGRGRASWRSAECDDQSRVGEGRSAGEGAVRRPRSRARGDRRAAKADHGLRRVAYRPLTDRY